MATAGVLFRLGLGESYLGGHKQGGTHRRRCTRKVGHTKGGLWPPQESYYLGGAGAGPRVERNEASVEHSEPQQRVRLCTHKAVHT